MQEPVYRWQTGDHSAPAETGSLTHFLVERYALFTADRDGELYEGHVSHTPYRVHVPVVEAYTIGPALSAGFTIEGPPVSVLAAEPVAVSIHPLIKRARSLAR